MVSARDVVLAGYAVHAAIRANADALPIWQHARQRVCAIALASGGAGDVDHWLRAGEGLSEAQAAAIAFDCAAVPA